LSISPAGTAGNLEITEPTAFSAVLVNSTADVTWTATGGTISSTSGLHVVYTPPAGTSAGSLVATAGGMTATVQISSKPVAITAKKIPGLTQPVTVQYDAQDIPHIKCATTIDCIAVQGYLQARDRLFPMDFLRHVAEGRLTELLGPDGFSQDQQLRTVFVTRTGEALGKALARVLDPNVRPIVQAFADGVNAYINELRASHGALPGEYGQLPFPLTADDVDLWTIEDTMALSRLQQFQLSETLTEETGFGTFALTYPPTALGGNAVQDAKFNAWIRAAAPLTEQAHTLAPTVFQPPAPLARSLPPGSGLSKKWKNVLDATARRFAALRQALRPADATVGSNNWVVSADKSATHVAMVANDPHLSLQYPPLFHLAVMTSTNASENLDLAGGSFPGIPGALVGRGAHVGWGVTVVGYDVTDVYIEKLTPCASGGDAPPCVMFKGNPVRTIPVPQPFVQRTGAGPLAAHSTTRTEIGFVVPHHGPVVQGDKGDGTIVSARWTGHEGNTQDTKAFLGLNTAANVDAAIVALKDFSTGAQNFVLADDQGHIAYDPHALVPVRNFADSRLVGANVQPPWFPLHGETGQAEWGTDPTVCAAATDTPLPAACWIADDLLPHGKDPAKGYFFTANADPIGVSDGNNPLLPANQPYLSFAWDDSSGFRATRIDQMLDAAIKAHGSVSLEDMKAIQADHVSRPGMAFTPIIDKILATLPGLSPELMQAKDVLDKWAAVNWDCPSGLLGTDPKHSPIDPTPAVVQASSGCFLFHEFLRVLLTNVFTDDLKVAGQGVNGLLAIKAMLFMLGQTDGSTAQAFCNDVDATGTVTTPHTCSAQVLTALVIAVKTLSAGVGTSPDSWVWGRVHTIQPVSLLALVTNGYEPGPYARPGGAFTVDVGTPSMSGAGLAFGYGSGGNVRHISLMDPKPVVKMQLPGPERDGPTVAIGPDLLGQWVKNSYFDFAFSSQIDGVAVATQTFTAP
jgi:penicillin amidase